MMFVKYPKVERLGNDEVAGITAGECWLYPKLDGTNASIWLEEGRLCAGSRNRQLSEEQDNTGFFRWLIREAPTPVMLAIADFLGQHPTWRLFGEWLVPHSLRTYRDDAWRKFYVFDVWDDVTESMAHPSAYDLTGIDCIPLLEICENPTMQHLLNVLERNTYLIKDGAGLGEGIVIKRYDFQNEYGRSPYAKLVRNKFKEKNAREFGPPSIRMSSDIETRLAEQCVTFARFDKVYRKMLETGPWSSKRIPELFSRMWHDVITEDMWQILKEHKRPVIDFRTFYGAVVQQVKRTAPDLFQ